MDVPNDSSAVLAAMLPFTAGGSMLRTLCFCLTVTLPHSGGTISLIVINTFSNFTAILSLKVPAKNGCSLSCCYILIMKPNPS
ncbi:hypothetical protein DL93DRAFT_2086163 [Clavulina sp. PMI_390]|nr:hypothetical protein DL93DRAFT_2086163 [Clavulina sp. PMI_390]